MLVSVAVHRLFLLAASGGTPRCGPRAFHCTGFPGCGAEALGTQAQQLSHELSCSAARGIFPDQGLNPCSLHWQAESYLPYHQRSLLIALLMSVVFVNGSLITPRGQISLPAKSQTSASLIVSHGSCY